MKDDVSVLYLFVLFINLKLLLLVMYVLFIDLLIESE